MGGEIDLKSKTVVFIFIWIIGFLLSGSLGCNSKDTYIGTYQAVDSGGGSLEGDISIELMENSKGVWKRGDEEIPFSWYIKRNTIRINTRDGGIIIGHLKRKGITMQMPGEVEITFRKIL
jgi:hypothetical protein